MEQMNAAAEWIGSLSPTEQNDVVTTLGKIVQEKKELEINNLEKQIAVLKESYEKLKNTTLT